MSDKIRERFEAIGRAHGNNLSKVDGYYLNDDTAAAWEGYQAATSDAKALVGELVDAMQKGTTDEIYEALTKAHKWMNEK